MSKEPSGCIETLVKDALNPGSLSRLDKHRPVIEEHYLLRIYFYYIQCNPEHKCIRFAIVDKAR